MGIGDYGLGIGDWGSNGRDLSPGTPIPILSAHSSIPKINYFFNYFF